MINKKKDFDFELDLISQNSINFMSNANKKFQKTEQIFNSNNNWCNYRSTGNILIY